MLLFFYYTFNQPCIEVNIPDVICSIVLIVLLYLTTRLIPDVSIAMQWWKPVILTKVSRNEFEKLRHDNLSESQLEQELTARGSNYAAIRHHHNIHKVN